VFELKTLFDSNYLFLLWNGLS